MLKSFTTIFVVLTLFLSFVRGYKEYFKEEFIEGDTSLFTRWKYPKLNLEHYSARFHYATGNITREPQYFGLYADREKTRYAISAMLPTPMNTTITNPSFSLEFKVMQEQKQACGEAQISLFGDAYHDVLEEEIEANMDYMGYTNKTKDGEKIEGYLTIVIVEAKLYGRHTDILTNMDLYVYFKVGNYSMWTVTLRNADMKKPYWDYEWELLVTDINLDLELYVQDEDWFWDDMVGETRMPVTSLINGCRSTGFKNWYPIYFKGEETGQIHLKGVWEPIEKPEDQKEPLKYVNQVERIVAEQEAEKAAAEAAEKHLNDDTVTGIKQDTPVNDYEEEEVIPPKITPDSFQNFAQLELTQTTPRVMRFGTRHCKNVSYYEIQFASILDHKMHTFERAVLAPVDNEQHTYRLDWDSDSDYYQIVQDGEVITFGHISQDFTGFGPKPVKIAGERGPDAEINIKIDELRNEIKEIEEFIKV